MAQTQAGHNSNDGSGITAWVPDLIYTGRRFVRDTALVCDPQGRIRSLVAARELDAQAGTHVIRLRGRAMLPGLVNAHSHAFQRVIRGRTEYRASRTGDSFWTWREMMYSAAERLTPDRLYDASRMAFLEMAASGITSVGEFHYLHRAPGGATYDDPNLLAKQVVRAARDVGIRIALLRVAYARSGFQTPPNARQSRFIEPDVEAYLRNVETLAGELSQGAGHGTNRTHGTNNSTTARVNGESHRAMPYAWAGLAPHSVRAVPLDYLREACAFAARHELPVHMHVAEQPAELEACVREHGRTPVALLADEGLLTSRFTGVHAIHITPAEIRAMAEARATVCACPTTERNLGDGIVPADDLLDAGTSISLGTDSHAQIDLLEDARELEYHVRLKRLERAVLAPLVEDEDDAVRMSSLAARLFDCATLSGARSIGAPSGALEPGQAADFFTVDLQDPSIAGTNDEDMLAAIVFSLARTAVRDVAVGGKLIVEDGRHAGAEEIVRRFAELQKELWTGGKI